VGGQRLNLIYTVEGAMRSGYLHPHEMYTTVLSGRVEVWTLTETDTQKTIYGPYEHFTVPAYVPHILYFLAPTTIAEWWDANVQFSCYYYHPYRKILDVQNSIFATEQNAAAAANNNASTSSSSTTQSLKKNHVGHHQFLIPQDQASIQQNDSRSFGMTTLLWMTVSGVVGAAVGAWAATAVRR
jgi:hypothetical protein